MNKRRVYRQMSLMTILLGPDGYGLVFNACYFSTFDNTMVAFRFITRYW